MAFKFKPKDFKDFKPDSNVLAHAGTSALIRQNNFINAPEVLALIGGGGTISSSYGFAKETIFASPYNPIAEDLAELGDAFQIAESNFSSMSILSKDSRELTKEDIEYLTSVIDALDNERVILTFGTYGIPNITRILAENLTKPKIVCVTGALLPDCFKKTDATFNGGGAVTAINAVRSLNGIPDKPVVFASFHGNIYTPEMCKNLNLHPMESESTVTLGAGFYTRRP